MSIQSLDNHPRMFHTKFCEIWMKNGELDFLFFQTKCVFSRFLQKKRVFFGVKICQIWAKTLKFLEINSNYLNTLYVQIWCHLNHFWQKKNNFYAFFGPFFALLIYKGKCAPAVIPTRALSAITFEPLVRFQKSWAFCREGR